MFWYNSDRYPIVKIRMYSLPEKWLDRHSLWKLFQRDVSQAHVTFRRILADEINDLQSHDNIYKRIILEKLCD